MMGKPPVLKPREVISVLKNQGSQRYLKEVLTSNTAMKMEGVRQFLFIKEKRHIANIIERDSKRYWFDRRGISKAKISRELEK